MIGFLSTGLTLGLGLLTTRSMVLTLGMIYDALTRPAEPFGGVNAPLPATILIPAYNEEVVLEAAVKAALLTGAAEILILDDGSTDRTPEIAERLARQCTALRLVRTQQNSGKAATLNRGIDAAQYEFLICVDADTVLAPDSVHRLLAPMIVDPQISAVAAVLKVGNRHKPFLVEAQVAEYALECERRRLQSHLNLLTTVPGAIGGFRKAALQAVGGFPESSLVEDTAATIELLAHRQRIVYLPGAHAWTEVPANLSAWFRQRDRWSAGFLETIRARRVLRASARLFVDELLTPLLGPWLCLAAAFSLPANWAVVSLGALLAATTVELLIAVHLNGDRRSISGWLRLLCCRWGYIWLTSIHLMTVIARLGAGRRISWNKLQRHGLG